jgi:glycerophosphoryl diester phosphodiesterase
MKHGILNLGHRGASAYAPENTAMAFHRAMAMGAHGVELDVHETAAGFIVNHDPVPDDGGGLSRLDDILDSLSIHPHAVIFLEIKTLLSWAALRPILEPMRGKLDIRPMSFAVEIVRQVDDDYRKGIIADQPGKDPLKLLNDCGAGLLSLRHDAVTPDLVRTLHDANLEIHAWTVNRQADMRRLLAMGIDGLISDFPDRVTRVLAEG